MDGALFIAGFSCWYAVVGRYLLGTVPSTVSLRFLSVVPSCGYPSVSCAPLERFGAWEDAPATACLSVSADRVIHFGLAAELPATVKLGLCSDVVHDVSYESLSLFIELRFCSLKTWLACTAKGSRMQVGLHSSAIEDDGHGALWLSCWTRRAQRMCEVESDFTHEKASVRIDVTTKSTGKLMIMPPVTVGARYLFRHSRRLLRLSL